MSAHAAMQSEDKAWLLRALLVLQNPRAVFAALREDSAQAAEARQEAVLALLLLAGIACVLWTPLAGRLLDQPSFDGILVVVWAFVGGAIYGLVGYWVAGAALFVGARGAGATASFRRARHLVAFAAAPLALSLFVVWPLRLAVYGSDVFRIGGSDSGPGAAAFGVAELGFVAWTLVLLVLGTRVVHEWTWARSLGAVALAALAPAAVVAATMV